MFQDEARYGLITGLKRTITARGVKAKVKYQHTYQYLWIWGSFSPLTGDAFYWETTIVNNNIFEDYIIPLSQRNLNKYIVLVIENTGFHATKSINIISFVNLLK